MILLSYDVESTGLDKQKDRIVEMGLVLYSTGQRKILESTGFLVQSDGVAITPEITEITGITQAAVDKFGYEQPDAFDTLLHFAGQADAVIGHNIVRFDMPMTYNTGDRLKKLFPPKLLIDTMTDIPGVKGEQLITMAAKHGWVNPNQHSAEDDAKDVLKLSSFYDIDKIVERAKSPMVILQSHQGRNNNADAKKFKFRWSPPLKTWWKLVKEMDVAELIKEAPFDISRLDKSVTLEMLDSDS